MPRQLVEYDPVLGHRYVPELKLRVPHESGGYLLQTNRLGFRSNPDFVLRRPASKRRVLLFGDSFTAGDGVSNAQRYSDVLEGLRPDLEVYNFGLPGSGTDQQYLAWQECAQDLEADHIVLAFQPENLRRNKLLSATSSIERTALSVVLSLAYVGLAALVLDFLTPWGITHASLVGSIWLILMLGVGVEVYGQGAGAIARGREGDRNCR